MKRVIFFLFLFIICCWPGSFNAATETKSYYISNFEVRLNVLENSAVEVSEYESVNFLGSFSYIMREIPYQGEMTIENIEIYDQADGHQLTGQEIEIVDTGHRKQITINFSALNEEKTWLIKYRARNVINFFSDYDELYWNVLPDDREVNVEKVKATVILPQAVSDPLLFQQKIYTGAYGSKSELSSYYIVNNSTLEFSGINIDPYYNFTIVAGWPKDIVNEPAKFRIESQPSADIYVDGQDTNFITPYSFWIGDSEIMSPGEHTVTLQKMGYVSVQEKINVQADENGSYTSTIKPKLWYTIVKSSLIFLLVVYLLSPLIIFFWLLNKWFKTGKDPEGKGTIIPQYEPYHNDPPGVMGTLLDEKADFIDITASIVDLAVRGYLKIIAKDDKKFNLQKIKDPDDNLLQYERSLLNFLFADKKEVALSDLSQKFYIHIKTIRDEMYAEVVNYKYFERNPHQIRKKYYAWGIGSLIFGAAGIFALFLGIPLIIIGIILIIFASRMPKRTLDGVMAKEWAFGFKMFLFHAERYRIKKMTPEYFESCLPYAMVFKVEKEWANNFSNIYKQPPSWYQGYHQNNLAAWSLVGFTASLSDSFAPVLKTTLTSMPSSRGSGHWGGAAGGSSGFGGGGFSGGGFGGGGFRAG